MTGYRWWVTAAIAGAFLWTGCGSDNAAQTGTPVGDGPSVEETEEDGLIVARFALDDDDRPDVIKYFEEYPDPDDEEVVLRRLRKKEVDVNSDGVIDIVRNYNAEGTPTDEELDVNLDGIRDARHVYDHGNLVRKDLFGADGKAVTEWRFYEDGTILRVEKDLNGDGKVDYWEFYEQGTIDRVGRDIDGDEAADQWTRR